MKYYLILILVTLLNFVDAQSQSKTDSIFNQVAKEYLLTKYEGSMQGIHHLYNGPEYIAYEPLKDEHPYFLTDDWVYSELKYDGEWFRNVPLLLDIDKEKLVASYYYNGTKMELVANRVDEFIFDGHHFINLKADSSGADRQGFYELLYDGKTKFYSKHKKSLLEKIEGLQESRSFKEVNQYYCLYNNTFNRISSKSDLLQLLKVRKKELKEFIRNEKLFSGYNREASIKTVLQYFDKISTE